MTRRIKELSCFSATSQYFSTQIVMRTATQHMIAQRRSFAWTKSRRHDRHCARRLAGTHRVSTRSGRYPGDHWTTDRTLRQVSLRIFGLLRVQGLPGRTRRHIGRCVAEDHSGQLYQRHPRSAVQTASRCKSSDVVHVTPIPANKVPSATCSSSLVPWILSSSEYL